MDAPNRHLNEALYGTAGKFNSPEAVNVHDFPTQSVGKAIPYGTYDVTRDEAAVNIGNMIDPRGKIRYGPGEDYLYGHSSLFSGTAQPRGIGKYLLTGRVEDPQNNPVEGAALRIGNAVLFTDSQGMFTLRTRKKANSRLWFCPRNFNSASGPW